jgi:hypothetical protein
MPGRNKAMLDMVHFTDLVEDVIPSWFSLPCHAETVGEGLVVIGEKLTDSKGALATTRSRKLVAAV